MKIDLGPCTCNSMHCDDCEHQAYMAEKEAMSLYEDVKATGGYIANHESDLYIEVNDTTTAILAKYPLQQSNARTFRNEVTGKLCYDVPFGYDPYWAAKAR